MTNEEKFNLITRNLEEILTPDELHHLIDSGTPLRHYIGFEISGKLHIGHYLALEKVRDLQEAGVETIIWLADIHAAINDKLDGNLNTIKRLAREYFVEAMKATFSVIGGDPEKLQFKLCSDTYAQNPSVWMTILEIGKNTTLARNLRSITIMGREQSEEVDSAKLMYPILQSADIYLLQVNIAHAGLDQRKVHVIARDVANQVKTNALFDIDGNQIKPVAIHNPILLGLTAPQIKAGEGLDISGDSQGETVTMAQQPNVEPNEDTRDIAAMKTKMSKSKADSGVSVHESPEGINRKIKQAYAPEGDIILNPILNWVKYLVFYYPNSKLEVTRLEKFGGDVTYTSYKELEKDYAEKKLHPTDLKKALAEWLINKLDPVRKAFEDPKRKKALEEIERLTKR